MSQKLTRLIDILNYSAKLLEDAGITDSRLNAELMLADVLNCPRIKLYLDFEKPLLRSESDKFKIFLKRRLSHEPLQYILGYTEFYGYRINVKKDVFIPRPDSEILVENLLTEIVNKRYDNVSIFEIGCGSGCLAVSIISELMKKDVFCHYDTCDINPAAVDLTVENLNLNGIDKGFSVSILDFLKYDINYRNYNYLISNPPYIPADIIKELDDEVKNYESIYSLTDNADGTRFLKRILELKSNSDFKAGIYVEIGDNQKERSEKLLQDNYITNYRYIKDLNGICRVLNIFT